MITDLALPGSVRNGFSLAAPIAAIVSYSLVVPFVGFMFQSPTPEIGAFLHGGLWTVLYVILGLTAMFKLRALFEHRPGWWGLVLGGSVFVAQIALATRAMAKEADISTAIGLGVLMTPASVPLAVAAVASAALMREKLPSGKVQHGVAIALVVLWIGFCSYIIFTA